MTREEEIKARLDDAKFNGPMCSPCEKDVRYLLARNEELQREKEKMQAVVDASMWLMECYSVEAFDKMTLSLR